MVEVKLGKLLRKNVVSELPLKVGAVEEEGGAPNHPSFLPHFSPAAMEMTATESPTKLPSTDTEVKK